MDTSFRPDYTKDSFFPVAGRANARKHSESPQVGGTPDKILPDLYRSGETLEPPHACRRGLTRSPVELGRAVSIPAKKRYTQNMNHQDPT
ncbi:hypothetical protein CVV65_04875 [Kyrpidia spormannii]|uniref:Uncharacterized protein n=1 Tax=Kyrpidia spormannii TaxID=2055160 RepID=A0A2K8N5J7_9BACL|nr:hypothetical protein CVV65_04875 [Kyrpidia spormannii]